MSTKFRVGDRVLIPLGIRKVRALISEDRGPLGVFGRRIYQVLVPADPFEPNVYEYPEDEIEPWEASPERALDPAQIMGYLPNGGLISILTANRAGGRDQPRVWLCRDCLGNVTHTFTRERGLIGGETVPYMASEGNRIFEPKQLEVSSFLNSFHLNSLQVQEVFGSVGSFPD